MRPAPTPLERAQQHRQLDAGRGGALAQREMAAAAVVQPEARQHRLRRRVTRDVADALVTAVARRARRDRQSRVTVPASTSARFSHRHAPPGCEATARREERI
jgi:hypothetical protein